MREEHSEENESKEIYYAELERYARGKIREYLQDLLEQEVSEWLGREKSERKGNALEQPGYRNGYGKPRRFTMSLGTIEVRRPRVRDLGERFVSKILPMFKRQSQEVRELIPELYLHGLASGDFEMALRELLGEGAPLSASSLQRLKEKWQGEYEQWKSTVVEERDWAYFWVDGILGRWDLCKGGDREREGGVVGSDRSAGGRNEAVFGAGAGVSGEQGIVG
jgi:putative transposase